MRIKLTSSQVNMLLSESNSQPEGIFYDIDNGDTITITTSGDKLSFKVLDQTPNAMWLRNTNEGSIHSAFIYLLAKSEKLDDADVSLFRYNEKKGETQADKKPFTFKNLTKIDVYDQAGKLKDSYTVGSTRDDDNVGFDIDGVLDEIKTMKVDDRYFFEQHDGTSLLFKVLEKTDAEAKLKLISVRGSDKDTYDPNKGKIFTFKFVTDSLEPSENVPDAINVLFYGEDGKPIILSNVTDWGDYYSTITDVKPSGDELQDSMSKDEILNMIMSNPTLRDTFYKQPKLMGFINAGDPVGIATANTLLKKFMSQNDEEESDGKIDEFRNFRKGRRVTFRLLEDATFMFNNRADIMKFVSGNNYEGNVVKDEGNTEIRSNKGSQEWKFLIRKSLGNNKYRGTMTASVKGKLGSREHQRKNVTIRVTNYNS